jgi:SAM-dependent methyltransferase
MRRLFSRQNFSGQSGQPDPVRLEPILAEWLRSPLGDALLGAERAHLAPIISRVFGYHVLQLSCAPEIDMLGDCPVCHQIHFAPAWNEGRSIPVANIESLPLATDSMDAVLLHHSLDYTQDSHRLLREATRVLRPGGRLIIVGFNPMSLWGLSKMVRWRKQTPWNARFISRRRLTDWLSLLDFHVESAESGGFLPPARHPRLLNLASDFERWFDRLGNPTGAFYLVVASKHRVPLIPVMPRWKRMRAPTLGSPLAETGRVASGRGTVVPLRPRRDSLKRHGYSNQELPDHDSEV